MARFITRKEMESIIQDFNKALFNMDVALEVVCEYYCKVDKAEFSAYCTEVAKKRIENANNETISKENTQNKEE